MCTQRAETCQSERYKEVLLMHDAAAAAVAGSMRAFYIHLREKLGV